MKRLKQLLAVPIIAVLLAVCLAVKIINGITGLLVLGVRFTLKRLEL